MGPGLLPHVFSGYLSFLATLLSASALVPMAQCYSSGSAPLNALANQLLGESSFAAKSSLVRHTQHISQQQPQHHSHYQGHFPRQPLAPVPQNHYHQDHVSLQKQRSSQEPKQIDPFEHAWSTSTGAPTASRLYHPQPRPVEPFYYDHGSLEHQRELPDLNLVTAWEQHLQAGNDGPLNQVQSALSGTSIVPPPSLLTSEFESFHYQPSAQDPSGTQDSAWAKEWATHRAQEEDDDDEDEFREEWSNDHFTQAYINTHRSKFQEIEEQERLKEARLEEERERQRQTSGGPPRSAWMMNGSTSAATIAAETVTGGTLGPEFLILGVTKRG
ncbi:hypothetical protein B0O80DRAFT_425955 [Mortierella sp. GBAus27b]|nr:hypothetical protein B0O80DRAFT_425955 [Mortierella sp. GBAus27b]